MASRSFQCILITPEARVFEEEATAAVLPLHDGSAGVLPHRAPFVAELGVGELRVNFSKGGSRSYFIDQGFVQMANDKLSVLAQSAIAAEQLIQNEVEAELAAANARKPQSGAEMEQVGQERTRARAKLDIARKFHQKGSAI